MNTKVKPMPLPSIPQLPKAGEDGQQMQNQGRLEIKIDDLRKERIFIVKNLLFHPPI